MGEVSRSRASTAGFLAYSSALVAGGGALIAGIPLGWYHDPFMPGLGGGLLVIAGASVFVAKVVRGSGTAPCPQCGARLGDLQLKGLNDGVLCTACGAFVEGTSARLGLTPLDRIADRPLFGAALPETFAWPEGCVVCRAPPTRAIPVSATVTNLGASAVKSAAATAVGALVGAGVLVRSGTTITVDVPHCSAHHDGAKLEPGTVSPANILFRSHAYARDFCATNGAPPAEAITHLRMQRGARRMIAQATGGR